MAKTVAVIGASSNREKFGNKAVRAFQRQGYTVIPITPREESVEGIPAFASILDVDGPIDMATLYVSPEVGLKVIGELAQKSVPEVWINPGADSPELLRKARELGLKPIVACSISAIGEVPALY
jgi:predicted CoA-binding protein